MVIRCSAVRRIQIAVGRSDASDDTIQTYTTGARQASEAANRQPDHRAILDKQARARWEIFIRGVVPMYTGATGTTGVDV